MSTPRTKRATRWRRRILLGPCVSVLLATGIEARAETELEAAEYVGSTTGAWTCGPTGRARYGGVGAQLDLSERAPTPWEGSGWVGQLGAAAEVERVRLIQNDGSGPDHDGAPPPDALQMGGATRVGYRWHWFGLQLGAMAFSGWRRPSDAQPSPSAFPQLELAFGHELTQSLFLGVGGASTTTMRRPAFAYIGLHKRFAEIHQLVFSGGLYRLGPSLLDTFGPRGDVVWRARVAPSLDLRFGCSINRGSDAGFNGEGSFGLALQLGQ